MQLTMDIFHHRLLSLCARNLSLKILDWSIVNSFNSCILIFVAWEKNNSLNSLICGFLDIVSANIYMVNILAKFVILGFDTIHELHENWHATINEFKVAYKSHPYTQYCSVTKNVFWTIDAPYTNSDCFFAVIKRQEKVIRIRISKNRKYTVQN